MKQNKYFTMPYIRVDSKISEMAKTGVFENFLWV